MPAANKYRLHIKTPNGFKADIQVQGDNLRVFTGDNKEGLGIGKTLYPTIWDTAEELGKKYIPDSELSFANQKRTTANMLQYIADRGGKGNDFVTIGKNQWGGRGLAGKPLTTENAKKLANNFIDEIEMNYMDKPIKDLSDSEVLSIGKDLGGTEHVRIGNNTISLLRKYANEGKFGAILGVIGMSQQEATEQ